MALSTVGRNVRTRVQWPQVDAVNSKGAVARSIVRLRMLKGRSKGAMALRHRWCERQD